MDLRPLGRTGVHVTCLCLGCMMFGRRTAAEDAYTIIDRALDAGINFLDTANVYDVIERLDTMAQSRDCTMVQLALAWVMAQPGITSPIVGPRTLEQMEEYLGAPSVTLSDADRREIDALVPPGGVVSAFYEADFGPHPYRVL
jgi:aryl-alcohol dehydrogenase-like predicted oxidoreductase